MTTAGLWCPGAAGRSGAHWPRIMRGQGRRVLALDRRFDPAKALSKGVAACTVDLLAEAEVRQAIAENLGAGDGISLLVNAVGQIWNEPMLTFRGAKLATHSLATWRSVHRRQPHRTLRRGDAGRGPHGSARRWLDRQLQFDRERGQCRPGRLQRRQGRRRGPDPHHGDRARPARRSRQRGRARLHRRGDDPRRRAPKAGCKSYAEKTPLGRLGRLDEVISAVEFLASNTFVNGTIVKVDGGLRL